MKKLLLAMSLLLLTFILASCMDDASGNETEASNTEESNSKKSQSVGITSSFYEMTDSNGCVYIVVTNGSASIDVIQAIKQPPLCEKEN